MNDTTIAIDVAKSVFEVAVSSRPGHVRARYRLSRDGFIEEDGEIWSRDGRLIAQSRQLALLQAPSQ